MRESEILCRRKLSKSESARNIAFEWQPTNNLNQNCERQIQRQLQIKLPRNKKISIISL